MRIYAAAMTVAALTIPALVQAQTAPQAPAAAATAPATATDDTKRAGRGDMSPEARARFEAFRNACSVDLKSHCGEVDRSTDSGRAAMRQCVETHQAKFTDTCRKALAERDAAREARKQTPAQPASTATDKPKS